MTASLPKSRADCEALDRQDPLADRRAAFALPAGLIYLDGHSLGAATHAALARVHDAASREWAHGLIRSWNDAGWIDLPRTVGARLARLIGVAAEDVLVTDTVSANLFKLAAAAMKLAKAPVGIVEETEFPTDQYVVEGLGPFVRARAGEGADVLADRGGVLVKSLVNYRTAEIADIAAHERAARDGGGVVVWDISHATGVIALDLAAQGALLACGCTYKFLNGGPGSPAFIYARSDVADRLRSPIQGWFGHADPFAFAAGYEPKAGVARFASGTPGVLSLSALDAALDAFDGIDMRAVQEKARRLGDLVIARAADMNIEALSPTEGARRGGHVSLRHEHGFPVVQALIARGVIPDFRAPDAMRFGVAPLYLRFVDVWDAMDQLADVLATREWDRPEFRRRGVVT